MTHTRWLIVCLVMAMGCKSKKSIVPQANDILTRAMACPTRACVQEIADHDLKTLFDKLNDPDGTPPDETKLILDVGERVRRKLKEMSN